MSLKKRLEEKAAGIGATAEVPAADSALATERAARTAPGQMLAFRGMLQESDAEIGKLRSELAKAGPSELALADLHEVPGRRRKLSDEDFAALKENLRQHALVTPVTVRAREEGGFEIVSGHNRVAALRELGRSTVKVAILQSGAEEADLSAFYANLMHPSLPDFAKFQGFERRMKSTGKTQRDVGREAGVNESTMMRWMSFGGLPDPILQLISRTPERVGGAAAAELVRLMATVGEEAVRKAVEDIVEHGVSQDQAIRSVRSGVKAGRPPNPKSAAIVIRKGKTTYCTARPKGQFLQLEFESAVDREALTDAILSLVRDHAKL